MHKLKEFFTLEVTHKRFKVAVFALVLLFLSLLLNVFWVGLPTLYNPIVAGIIAVAMAFIGGDSIRKSENKTEE
jgi:hypothetical protein